MHIKRFLRFFASICCLIAIGLFCWRPKPPALTAGKILVGTNGAHATISTPASPPGREKGLITEHGVDRIARNLAVHEAEETYNLSPSFSKGTTELENGQWHWKGKAEAKGGAWVEADIHLSQRGEPVRVNVFLFDMSVQKR
jgi:hypothetical protein